MTKQNLIRLLGLLLLTLSSSLFAQALTARLDRDHIGLEETFTLILRYDGQTNASPDFNQLRRDFEIIHTQSGSQMEIINNQVSSYIEWRLTMAPLKSGVFTIPAFSLGNHSSQPLIITVEPQKRSGTAASGEEIFVEVEIDKSTAFVQEQIILTVKLVTPVSLEQILLDPIEPENALVIKLEEAEFQTTINGVPHGVIQTRFALFAQRSGTLTIPSVSYQVLPARGRRSLLSQFYGTPSGSVLRLHTDEKQVDIKGVPAEATGMPWLPASNLQLEEHWSRDAEALKVGEPVTRSIKIIADGLTPGQITNLVNEEQEGLTFYPDQPQTDEHKTTKGVVGTRVETQAIVPTRSGSYTLPPVRIQWWDTVNNKMRIAELPARELKVEDNPLVATSQAPGVGAAANSDATAPLVVRETLEVQHLPLWLILVTSLTSFTSLLFAFLYWRTRRELGAIRGLFIEEQQDQQIAEDKAWRLLKRASTDKDWPALRKAVLIWARLHYRNPNLHSLQTVATQTQSEALREQLLKLDSALYGNLKGEWDSGELLQAIYACKKDKRDKQKVESGLNPLYQGQ